MYLTKCSFVLNKSYKVKFRPIRRHNKNRNKKKIFSRKSIFFPSHSLLLIALFSANLISLITNQTQPASSELNLDSLSLATIPRSQICSTSNESNQPINLVSLADNNISQVNSMAFSCLGETMRILVLSHNKIDKIDDFAFVGLDQLQVLLLDSNKLSAIPDKKTLEPLKLLRHLNLADNLIEIIQENAFGASSSNLISLNLQGNSIHRLSENSLASLVKLTTLTLSQCSLDSLPDYFIGLDELRFLHLDREANLSWMPSNLCQSSRKLASLVLKSNELIAIPKFAHCQSLLLLDLSYNHIGSSLGAGNFLSQPKLIDLYLGHNQLEFIDERAFVGLHHLQVLELNDNRLKLIHPAAFLAPSSSLLDLNIAHNPNLAQLSALGLDGLVSFKAFGCQQLRSLPYLKSASSLALTYAYHCCDYVTSAETNDDLLAELSVSSNSSSNSNSYSFKTSHSSLLLPQNSEAEAEAEVTRKPSATTTNHNLSELVLWPNHLNLWKTKRLKEEVERASSVLGDDSNGEPRRRKTRRSLRDEHGHLIDEIVRQVSQIRAIHSVGLADNQDQIGANSIWSQLISSKVQLQQFHNERQHKTRRLEDEEDSHSHLDLYSNLERDGGADELLGLNGSQTGDQTGEVNELAARKLEAALRGWPQRLAKRHSHRAEPERAGVQCMPRPSAFLPCRDLFDTWLLRAGIWCVFLLAFTGNILVIVVLGSVRPSSSNSALTSIMWLAHSKRHIDVPRFLVINLALADLLMALYLGILAIVDLSTLGEFRLFAIKWQYSTGCKLAGFLGVLSSELSVFILAVITLERNYAITNAVHLNRRLSLQKAMVIMFFGYSFALCMAILPLNGISDYRKFSICLPLDMSSSSLSQIYIITLITMNTFSFILLLACYLRMYCAIRGSQAWNANDLKIAKRMSILVVTDFLCWMPIIVAAIASLFGYYLIGTKGLKVLTIFILPLNSIANPFLYAITTKKFKRDLETLTKRMRSFAIAIGCYRATTKSNSFDFMASNHQHQHHHHHHYFLTKRADFAAAGRKPDKRKCRLKLIVPNIQDCQVQPQTINQVTINRTTCACQQKQTDNQDKQLDLVNESMHLQQPRIVLEQLVEPVEILRGPDLSAFVAPDNSSESIPLTPEIHFGDLSYRDRILHKSHSNVPDCTGSFVLVDDLPARCSAREPDNTQTKLLSQEPVIRPRSAEDSAFNERHVQCINLHTSCHAILVKSDEKKRKLFDVKPANFNRCASACGYRSLNENNDDEKLGVLSQWAQSYLIRLRRWNEI